MIKLKLYAAAIGAFILAVLTFGQIKKREGRKDAENKHTADQLKAMQKHNENEKEVSDADRDTVINILTK